MKALFYYLSAGSLALSTTICSAQPGAPEMSLANAVEAFNARAKSDPVGTTQPRKTLIESIKSL